MKSAFRTVSLSVLLACAECVLADVTVRQNIVGPGTSSRASAFTIASGASADVTITANEGFVISSIVTNGVPVGEVGDFTGQSSATMTISSEDDVDLVATFVTENAWWLDPFVRNCLYVSSTGYLPEGCNLDPDEVYFAVGEGDSSAPPGIHLYSVEELKNSVDNTLLSIRDDNNGFVSGESGAAVAVSSRYGAVFPTRFTPECSNYVARLPESDWSREDELKLISVDNLGDYYESLELLVGGAFGNDGYYVADYGFVNFLEPDVSGGVITNFTIADGWECPAYAESVNVKTVNGVDYVYGISLAEPNDPGNSILYVIDTDSGNITMNYFWAEEIDNGYELVPSVSYCYSQVQTVGVGAGTPRVVVKDDYRTYILDLDSDCKTLVSPYPVVTFENYTDQIDLYDPSASDIGGLGVTDDETRMFNLCCYDIVNEDDGEFIDDTGTDGGDGGDDEGDGQDVYDQIVCIKVFEKTPAEFKIEGVFVDGDDIYHSRSISVPAGEGTNVVFTAPFGYIESVTTNGVPVADFTRKSQTFTFSSGEVLRHVCVKMFLSPLVARIGSEEYRAVEDALADAVDGDTIEVLCPTSIDIDRTVSDSITIDTCGYTLTNRAVITICGTGCLVITNNDIAACERSFVNNERVIVSDGAKLDIHAITLSSGPRSELWKADLDNEGSYEIKSGGFVILPDTFRWWCISPEDVEGEVGDYKFAFFKGTETNAVVYLNRGDPETDGSNCDKTFRCTGVSLEGDIEKHVWNTPVALYEDVYYTDISAAVTAADGNPLTLLADVSYELSAFQTVVIESDWHSFGATVPEGYTLRTSLGNGITTYFAAKNIDDVVVAVSSVTYDGNNHMPQITSVTDGNDILVENVDFVISGGPFKNAGSYSFDIVGTNRYASSISKTFTISRKALTVTARDTTALYGEDPFYMVSYSGFVDGENALVFTSFPTVSGAYKPKNKATWTQSSYTITPSGAAADNYEFSYVSGTLTLNRRNLTNVSVVQTGELTEDGTPQVATVSATATAALDESVTFTYSATQNGTYSSLVPAFTEAGTYTVYYKANANYHNESTGTFQVTVAEGGPDEEPEMISAAFVGADGKFHVTVAGTDSGRDYTAYTTSDLSIAPENWAPGQVIQGNGGTITFELTHSGPKKFVRVVSSRHK